ncbi:hypothetical protein E5Q_02536 [Mixia osmundae IAM 14324]|uniref:HAD-superfamily hydrolase n=2 Tax=Mixia osmundae (strain CBS 9802 / IAM 14324 / JCM 22182 / KY 12970) TaxID=764103 RepID=G7DZ69_MIXOS|nr:hypothetical protein E5Q_02536 [Mixia osmundae IAM 14324]
MLRRSAIAQTAVARRRLNTSARSVGFAFDIDGVLLRGRQVIPEAKTALRLLKTDKVPFILLTNGGGLHESERVKKLSDQLDVEITIDMLQQAHTPYRDRASEYKDKAVLIVGGHAGSPDDHVRNIAVSYGFERAYSPGDIHAWAPSIYPFGEPPSEARQADFSKTKFEAIFVFHDSLKWYRDIQIMSDVLTSPDGHISTDRDFDAGSPAQSVPVFFSNPDLIFGNDYVVPRFGQGAFQEALRAVYKRISGHDLKAHVSGKPERATYQFADGLLRGQNGGEQLKRVYMVGDNPQSDIKGANDYGWQSMLVRTGVFRGTDKHATSNAGVYDNVLLAVEAALSK